MRIISGEFRRRQIYTPAEDMQTRPIPDRVRESVFGILRGHFEGATVVDFFAGTGVIGLEALSRGARSCVFVERDRDVAKMLHANIDLLGCGDRAEVVLGDALGAGALARCPRPTKLAWFDPPYPLVRDPVGWSRVKEQAAKVAALLSDDGYLILRLPHPFVHELNADGTPLAPAEPRADARRQKRKMGKGKERFDWRKESGPKERSPKPPKGLDMEPDEFADEALLDEIEAGAEAKPDVQKVWPSLELDGAVGPETHVYGSMAVHLYMRRRGATGAASRAS